MWEERKKEKECRLVEERRGKRRGYGGT